VGREEQIAKNELRFRRLNDEIGRLSEGWHHDVLDAFCECGDAQCFGHLLITPGDYRRIRDERHFIVLPGHEMPDVETVVARAQNYVVVRKPEEAVQRAERESG
jgi:hypothetical protein